MDGTNTENRQSSELIANRKAIENMKELAGILSPQFYKKVIDIGEQLIDMSNYDGTFERGVLAGLPLVER